MKLCSKDRLLRDLTEAKKRNQVLSKEVWKLQKDVAYWQESCQNISEEAYDEHIEMQMQREVNERLSKK
tara:strand:- start:403 stop:609 length:207 start_codon:yes stop_codon:yes gene_type:complete